MIIDGYNLLITVLNSQVTPLWYNMVVFSVIIIIRILRHLYKGARALEYKKGCGSYPWCNNALCCKLYGVWQWGNNKT